MKNQEDGTVIQRFCIAILQKTSSKEESIPAFMKHSLIDWIIKLLLRSRITEIHVFCLDFATALLANILHSNITLEYLEKNLSVCKNVNSHYQLCFLLHLAYRNLFINDQRKHFNFSSYAYAYNFVIFKQG